MTIVQCDNCGTSIDRAPYRLKRGRNYCNNACRGQWRSRNLIGEASHFFIAGKTQVLCDHCGKSIERFPYQLKDSKRHFCCRECANLAMRNNEVRRIVECHSCGTSIERRVTTQKHFFCGDRCRGDWMKRNHIVRKPRKPRNCKCEYCDKPVRRGAAHIKRNKIHFCSIKCKGSWFSENWREENNPAWKGGEFYYGPNWKRQRRKARKRDNYICQSCGMSEKENGQALDAHHIMPFRKFTYIPSTNENYKQANRLSNLVCLCRQCHQFVEHGRIAVQLSLPTSVSET